MNTRLYVVTGPDSKQLVEAASQSAAIRSVVEGQYSAKPATAKEVQEIMRDQGGYAKTDDTVVYNRDGQGPVM